MTTTQRGVFDFLKARGEEVLTQVSNELMSNPRFIQAMQTALRGKEWMDQGVARALKTMNVPTRSEFKRALGRIEALERELAETRRQVAEGAAAAAAARTRSAAPARGPRRTSRGKKAASRRKVARAG